MINKIWKSNYNSLLYSVILAILTLMAFSAGIIFAQQTAANSYIAGTLPILLLLIFMPIVLNNIYYDFAISVKVNTILETLNCVYPHDHIVLTHKGEFNGVTVSGHIYPLVNSKVCFKDMHVVVYSFIIEGETVCVVVNNKTIEHKMQVFTTQKS